MKNKFSTKWMLLIPSLLFFLTANAALPPLGNGYPTVTLPYTFTNTNSGGYIDIDGVAGPDYLVTFHFSTGSSSYCYIQQYSGTGNEMMVEYVGLNAPSASNPPLSYVNPTTAYTALLDNGAFISGESHNWDHGAYISYRSGQTSPLGSNYTTPDYSGYIGIHYFAGPSDLVGYYGWLWTEIDPSLMSVTIGSAGHSESPGTGIYAGSGSAVPIPLIASIFGFGLIGGGVYLKRRKK